MSNRLREAAEAAIRHIHAVGCPVEDEDRDDGCRACDLRSALASSQTQGQTQASLDEAVGLLRRAVEWVDAHPDTVERAGYAGLVLGQIRDEAAKLLNPRSA